MELTGGAEKRAAIQLEMSAWLRKRCNEKLKGHVLRRGGYKRSFGDHVILRQCMDVTVLNRL
jgi:hypothetical protein